MDYRQIDLSQRLGYILHDKMCLEWMKYTMYKDGDPYHEIPALYLKFKVDSLIELNNISKRLSLYKGIHQWCIFKYPFSKNDLYCISTNEYRLYCNQIYELSKHNEFALAQDYWGQDKYNHYVKSTRKDLDSLCDFFINM